MTTATEEHLARLHLPPCRWAFPPPAHADPSGLVVVGGDLAPETLVTAYTSGLFPMPVGRRRRIGWWSPEPRGVLPVDALRVSRSLRRSTRRYEVRVDTAFTQTMTRCGDPRRPHGWITSDFIDAYSRLHDLGVAHSIECWSPEGELVGGLYGISLGGLFAGESMFHAAPDASKVALVALVELLGTEATTLLDIQWLTPHLASLGGIEIGRDSYLASLAIALRQPTPTFTPGRWSAARSS